MSNYSAFHIRDARSLRLKYLPIYFSIPAIPNAPAGSKTERVSLKAVLIAAQISSVLTVIISSTSSSHMRNVSVPTTRTDAQSANKPTDSNGVTKTECGKKMSKYILFD